MSLDIVDNESLGDDYDCPFMRKEIKLMEMEPRGAFIVLEGLDRTGKTTQTQYLWDSLCDNHDIVKMRFPDRQTMIGSKINDFLQGNENMSDEVIHLLYSANRWEKNDEIVNILNEGTSIICDRYAYSGVVYSNAKGLNMDWCKSSDVGLVEPDAVVFLDIDNEILIQRPGFGQECYETLEFQKKVRKSYQKIMDEEEENNKWHIINANRPVMEIHDEILSKISIIIENVKNSHLRRLWDNKCVISKKKTKNHDLIEKELSDLFHDEPNNKN